MKEDKRRIMHNKIYLNLRIYLHLCMLEPDSTRRHTEVIRRWHLCVESPQTAKFTNWTNTGYCCHDSDIMWCHFSDNGKQLLVNFCTKQSILFLNLHCNFVPRILVWITACKNNLCLLILCSLGSRLK